MGEKFTHYSYLVCPVGYREPTGLFDLAETPPDRRKALISDLIKLNGELLARVPGGGTVTNMAELRAVLKRRWENGEKP